MNTFRRRIGNKKEYSGHNEATEQLRNRLINSVSHYIGQPSPYSYGLDNFHGIYRETLNDLLDTEYGVQNSNYISYLRQGEAEDVFTVIEIIIKLGHEQLYRSDFVKLVRDIVDAFSISGSVYEISQDGLVVLKLDDTAQADINDSESLLNEFQDAQQKYKDAVGKLIRREEPSAVVQDSYLSLEMYVKAKSGAKGKNAFDDGVNKLLSSKPVQKEFVRRLKGFKGNAKDISHAGSYIVDEKDALWYVRSIGAVFSLLESEENS